MNAYKTNCLKCELKVAGSDLGSDQLSTNATLMGTGTSDSITTPDNVDYIALHTGASTVPNGLSYINGFDQAAGASGVVIDLNTPIDVTGVTDIEYCFYLYNAQDPDQSDIVDSASRYKSYSITPKDVVITTDAGNVTAQYTLTTDDIDNTLFIRDWLQVCVTATLPAGATQITQITQILEHLGGTSGADFDQTREVFAIAPSTIRATPTPSCKSVCEHLQELFDRVGEIEKTGASDDQEILVSISGSDVTFEIEGGNSQTVDFGAFVSDPDVFVTSFINDGTDIVITMSDGSELSVPLASLPDEDQQVLSVIGNDISISNGNTITIPVDTDTQNTVSEGDNVSITETTSADGTTNYEISCDYEKPCFEECLIPIAYANINADGTIASSFGEVVITRLATGRYQAQPISGAVSMQLSVVELYDTRDSITIRAEDFTTAWHITDGDNGGTANIPRDRQHMVVWYGIKTIAVECESVTTIDDIVIDESQRTNAGWDNEPIKDSTRAYSGNVKLEYTISQLDLRTATMIGLNSDPDTATTWQNLDYASYILHATGTTAQFRVYENGGFAFGAIDVAVGDIICVERVGATITYSVNGAVVYTSLTPSTGDLYLDSIAYGNAGYAGNLGLTNIITLTE